MSKDAFEPVPSPFNFAEAENETIVFWKEHGTYKKSLEQRKDAPPFVFFEGPPTANGMPHPGHCLTRTIKDIFPRYKTMAGNYCERKAGWDTHGLPVEIEVCKELGIIDGGKEAIEDFGVEKFNRTCIESVFRYKKEWEQLTDRIGFWVDLDEAYVTFHQSYVESVWWALKQLFDRGLLYQGHKVVWWWPQGGTALSAGEVGEGYRDVDDPAVTVKFEVTEASLLFGPFKGLKNVFFLVWTTTPWTLSSNCAIAVSKDITYAVVKDPDSSSHLVLAEKLVEKYFGSDAEIVLSLSGSDLENSGNGVRYNPLFRYTDPIDILTKESREEYEWKIIAADFVELDTGTGLVHLAPAFGEDDYRVCREKMRGFLCYVKPDGTFDERVTDVDPYDQAPIAGQFCKKADKSILRVLKERGQLFKHEQHKHSYPFCPRAENDPLIQYARKSWFIKTSQFKDDFVANNKEVTWQPSHIRDGRFGNFLENNVDWALSRERYWGTPLPVWVCDKTGYMECICTYDELLAKPGLEGTDVWLKAKAESPELSEHLKVHKPYIDAVTFQNPHHLNDPECRMRRVTEVIDVWFDAGCMPFAQWGYPHLEGSEKSFDNNFPADFISEAIDQTRGWFYALLAISTVVHEDKKGAWPHPFKNCICLGHILGEDGRKLSKRLKNYSEPGLLFEKFSADALRWSFVAKNPPTNSSRLSERIVEESQRELLMRWYNVYSFFVIYANLDGFDPSQAPQAVLRELFADPATAPTGGTGGDAVYRPAAERTELDRWILSELDRVVVTVREAMDHYETYPAAREISGFVDGLSNWYVRRSRSRFWASGWSEDKADAYWTLYECLIKLARLAAPFTPFFAEVTWRNLAKPVPGASESVHLATYPEADATAIDHGLLEQMALTREAVTLGLSARRVENIKVRQPLGLCELVVSNPAQRVALENHLDLIKEELNIKEVAFTDSPEDYVSYDVRPNFKVLGPRFGKNVQQVRKALAGADGAALLAQLQDGGIKVEIDGNEEILCAEEVDVRLTPKDGFAAAQGKQMVVVIATEITAELRKEGLVREVIRALQDIRKEQNLAYDARINVTYATDDAALQEAIADFREYIAQEVLASALESGDVGGDAKVVTVEGSELRLLVTVG